MNTEPAPSSRSLHSLDWLNFFLADIQTGVGPFLAVNAAMLPELGEMLSRGRPHDASLFMSAAVTVTQLVIACSAAWIGKQAQHAGYSASFLALAAIASVAVCLLWILVPETRQAEPARIAPMSVVDT